MALYDDGLAWATAILAVLIAILDITTVLPHVLHPEGTAGSIAAGLHTGSMAAYWYGFVNGYVLVEMLDLPASMALYAMTALPVLISIQGILFAALVPLSKRKAGARAVAIMLTEVCLFAVVFLLLGLLFVSVPRFPDEAMLLFFLQLGFALAVVVYAVEFCVFFGRS